MQKYYDGLLPQRELRKEHFTRPKLSPPSIIMKRELTSMPERKDMDIVQEVQEILALQNPYEKDDRLEQLSDVLEYHHRLNETDIVEGVRLLLPAALQEDDKDMQQTVLRAIENAVVHHDVGDRIDWDGLVASLSALGKWDLEYALNVLGLSGQARYLLILNEYAHHADPEISEWAQEAIREIEYRVAHASPAQKAG